MSLVEFTKPDDKNSETQTFEELRNITTVFNS